MESPPCDSSEPHKPPYARQRRPRWLMALLLIVAVWQGGRAVHTLNMAAFIDRYTSLLIPLEVGAGLLWSFLAISALIGLWRRVPRAILYAIVLLSVFAVYSALRLALFARADYARQRLPLLLLAAVIAIVITMVALAWRWRVTRKAKECFEDGSGPED